jgi:hypothetical protein
LFGITLLLIGLIAGGFIGEHFFQYWRARDYEVVPARVLSFDKRVSEHRGGPSYQVSGVYEYQVGGKTYLGHRLGLRGHSDDLQTAQELQDAQESGRLIRVWIDPKRPERSIKNRELDSTHLAQLLCLHFMMLVIALALLDRHTKNSAAKLRHGHFHRTEMRQRFFGFGVLTVYGNVFTWAIFLALLPDWGALWVLAIGMAGLLAAGYARRDWVSLRQLGEAAIRWKAPIVIGEPVSLELELERPENLRFVELVVACTECDGRPRQTRETTLWARSLEGARDFRVTPTPGVFEASLTLPQGLPRCTITGGEGVWIEWSLTLVAPSIGTTKTAFYPDVLEGSPVAEKR